MDENMLARVPDNLVAWVTDPVVLTVFAIVLGTMVLNFVLKRILYRIDKRVAQTSTVWDDALLHAIQQPLSLLIWVLGMTWAADVISARADTGLSDIVEPFRYVAVVVLIALFLTRFVKELENGFIHNGADVTTANAIGKLIRISIVITAALSVLQTL
ncbi:MAG: hypothetical protein KDI36_15440, partial [Pseudomonadales bacterium]|nr:hypothetical protein [Pseudomonadales bacterium]